MNRGDIYLVALDPTHGREPQGYRPVVVISPDAFNATTKLPVVLLITGIKTTGVVRCDQPRVLDVDARHGRQVDALPPPVLDEVLARAVTLFQ